MLLRLAWATLTRHRSRTLLAILGVAVSAAMLLDMVMLSSGMRGVAFANLLLSRGFQLRLAPKGTLPFDTDATIADVNAISRTLSRDAGCSNRESRARRAAPRRDRRPHDHGGGARRRRDRLQGDYEVLAGPSPDGRERVRGERRLPPRERTQRSATRSRPPPGTIRSFARSRGGER